MAFLSSTGNIILDAVLTDAGRKRLARADGTFKIAKFAVFDDEIDYTDYNKSHASGSSYFDVELLSTPVLEAFTNNTSVAKSFLVSYNRTNLLYLPIIKQNDVDAASKKHASGSYVVSVDEDTEADFANVQGFLYGYTPSSGGGMVRLDQGLDTTESPPTFSLEPSLVETQYIVEIDNRLGYVVDKNDAKQAAVSYIDDDNIASYLLTLGNDVKFVRKNESDKVDTSQVISGPRGTILEFKIQASIELNSSTYLFTTIGTTGTGDWAGYYYIDANVRITGATTGYALDVPVRFLKKV